MLTELTMSTPRSMAVLYFRGDRALGVIITSTYVFNTHDLGFEFCFIQECSPTTWTPQRTAAWYFAKFCCDVPTAGIRRCVLPPLIISGVTVAPGGRGE